MSLRGRVRVWKWRRQLARLRAEGKLCQCCEDGFYCRHRCAMHPKANGLDDSGKPWREPWRPEARP